MAAGDKPQDYDLEEVATHILEASLYNIVHELVLSTHRKEKTLLQALDPKTHIPLCHSCGLPRLLDPPLATSVPDKSTQYCSAIPWSTRAGHDIYGNPFPIAGSEKQMTKKEREAQARAAREERQRAKREKAAEKAAGLLGTAAVAAGDADAPGGGAVAELNIAGGPPDKKSAKVDEKLKTGNYTPWHTCPSCKRSLLITRFAQHLEKCLGIGGRGRAAAAARDSASNASGTPKGDRAGTPGSIADDDDDVDASSVRKKVLKKAGKAAAVAAAKDAARHTIKLTAPKHKPIGSSATGNTNGNGTNAAATTTAGTADGGVKRDRNDKDDDDDDDYDDEDVTPLRKKQKLQRANSTASMLTDAASLLDESVDGSFIVPDDEDAEGAESDD